MAGESYPWRVKADLRKILTVVRPIFVKLDVIEDGGGHTDAELVEAERRMGRPLPSDLREFYGAMQPNGIGNEFGFFPLDSKELSWRSMQEAEPAHDWISARALTIGRSAFGDPFWWVEGHRLLPTGSIVLLDHDGGLGGDVMFVHYARCFREFIVKVAFFKGLYAPPGNQLFQKEYRELNPSAKL